MVTSEQRPDVSDNAQSPAAADQEPAEARPQDEVGPSTSPAPQTSRNDFDSLIQLGLRILPALAVFSAASYTLGRLYLESYYDQFGIPRTALQFSNQDYLFQSLEMVVLGAMYVGVLWLSFAVSKSYLSDTLDIGDLIVEYTKGVIRELGISKPPSG